MLSISEILIKEEVDKKIILPIDVFKALYWWIAQPYQGFYGGLPDNNLPAVIDIFIKWKQQYNYHPLNNIKTVYKSMRFGRYETFANNKITFSRHMPPYTNWTTSLNVAQSLARERRGDSVIAYQPKLSEVVLDTRDIDYFGSLAQVQEQEYKWPETIVQNKLFQSEATYHTFNHEKEIFLYLETVPITCDIIS